MARKLKQKKARGKAKTSQAKAKSRQKKAAPKRKSVRKVAVRGRRVRETQATPTQSIETMRLKGRARAAAGAGGGDFGGASTIESADSESPDELLEEGQTFESGIVSGVQNAREPDEGEVRTREVPEDDVPEEYDDDDRP